MRAVVWLAAVFSGSACGARSLVFNERTPHFGATQIGEPSQTKTLSVTNTGPSPVLIQSISVSTNFSHDSNCGIWLAEGSSCLIFVTFTPNVAGRYTGYLTIGLAGRDEQSVPLVGFGISRGDAAAAVEPRTTNDEEKAQELLGGKGFNLQKLLERAPADIENAKKVFVLTVDTKEKLKDASVLLSTGARDQHYFDYLASEARKALAHDHDMPWPILYDEEKQPKALNPALNEWCKLHGVGFWDVDKIEFYEIPTAWLYLSAAGDERAYDLLIEGLHSKNLMIVSLAAQGLAKLQDPRAIEELIASGRGATGEALAGIVQSLIYFSEPRAQAAAEELLPPTQRDLLKLFRDEKKKSGMRALFQW